MHHQDRNLLRIKRLKHVDALKLFCLFRAAQSERGNFFGIEVRVVEEVTQGDAEVGFQRYEPLVDFQVVVRQRVMQFNHTAKFGSLA
mgnify:CR=1 FL=1